MMDTMARTVFYLVSIQATEESVYKYATVCLLYATTSMDAKILQVLYLIGNKLQKSLIIESNFCTVN